MKPFSEVFGCTGTPLCDKTRHGRESDGPTRRRHSGTPRPPPIPALDWSGAYSVDPDQPFRPIVITDSGDPDHGVHYARMARRTT
jgi:hypothetical protein